MSNQPGQNNPAVLSYLSMRKAVGFIALTLPFALIGGTILLNLAGPAHALPEPLLQIDISAYYFTIMGSYLVGALCSIAVFMVSCRGYDRADEIASYLACVSALGVAFLPTTNPRLQPSALERYIANTHTGFAAMLFLTLAYFCLFLFTKTTPDQNPTARKVQRNRVYVACGWTIVGCIVVMVSLNIAAVATFLEPMDPLLCFQSVAILAFGLAWLVKGEAILKDEEPQEA